MLVLLYCRSVIGSTLESIRLFAEKIYPGHYSSVLREIKVLRSYLSSSPARADTRSAPVVFFSSDGRFSYILPLLKAEKLPAYNGSLFFFELGTHLLNKCI